MKPFTISDPDPKDYEIEFEKGQKFIAPNGSVVTIRDYYVVVEENAEPGASSYATWYECVNEFGLYCDIEQSDLSEYYRPV